MGELRAAKLYLQQAATDHPRNAEAVFRLAEVDLALGNPDLAEPLLRRAGQLGYDPVALIAPLGLTYMRERRFEDALRDFDPDHAPPGGAADPIDDTPLDDVYALERRAFMALLRQPATLARIEHMLETGKPLRN